MDINKLFVGRVGRKKFFLASLVLFVINVLVMIPIGAMKAVYMYGGMYRFGMEQRFADFHALGSLPIAPMIIAGVIFLASLLIYFGLVVRRLHDFDQSGLWSLFVLVSPVSLILYIILLVKKGDAGQNKYGDILKAPVSWKKLLLNVD